MGEIGKRSDIDFGSDLDHRLDLLDPGIFKGR